MTDKKSDSRAVKSERRRQRYEARRKVEKKLGRKLRKGEVVDHVSPKMGGDKYNNSSDNLKAVSKSEHKKKMRNSKRETGGRPRGSKDSAPRKQNRVRARKGWA